MSVKFNLNVYGLTGIGTKIPIGRKARTLSGYNYCGGILFYIDSSSDESVEFYDQYGEPIDDVEVGDQPYAYRITDAGTSGKKKYYFYYPTLYTSKRWTWYDSSLDTPAYVYNSLGTGTAIGTGETNTETVMAADSGAYVTNDSNGVATIWYTLSQMNANAYGGCNDWFVPSKNELEQLRLFLAANATDLGLTNWFTNNYIWSSSEHSAQNAWYWDYSLQAWNYNPKNHGVHGVCGVRAF